MTDHGWSAAAALPGPLRSLVEQWFVQHAGSPEIAKALSADPGCAGQLSKMLACSPYAAGVLARYPQVLAGVTSPAPGTEVPGTDAPEAEFVRQLRIFRHRELVRVIWRDLGGAASIEQALQDLSSVADTAICAALLWADRSLRQRHGTPRDADGHESRFAVLAMGKLGGRELNFSSDVDLVFLFSAAGETDGLRPISNEEYFRLLAQRLISLLSQKTADGFVYRVDVRLRPFGDSGPLAVSLSAFEGYLMQHGRDWERYAYIKARVLNEWPDSDTLYNDVLRPFVYRRYLDYGVFGSLREMKAMIEAEVERREFQRNLKLGPGGIREIEFIAQSLQLVRGGSHAQLRERELLRVLPRLAEIEYLPGATAAELAKAYRFLRALENRVQAIGDQQTHELPEDETGRARITLAMGFGSWDAMLAELDQHRAAVARHFRNVVFRSADGSGAPAAAGPLRALWLGELTDEDPAAVLRAAGYAEPPAVLERLQRLRADSSITRLDEPGRQRLDVLMPAVLGHAAVQADPLRALDGVARVIESIGRRSAYFALLNENPAACERLVSLCGMSGFLARQIAASPVLLDELLDPRLFSEPPTREELAEDLSNRMRGVASEDTERRLLELRSFQQAARFRIAVADLSGILPLMKVSDRLTEAAELVLQGALDQAWLELAARHGAPRCRAADQIRPAQFVIVAYGKLGGLELGYASDLDVVFLHDSAGEVEETEGPNIIENDVFFARLARRIIGVVTMPIETGHLYEVDTRLRPSGRSGLLVSRLAAFEQYQREHAWTWEHQALLRGRAVAGSQALRGAFEALRVKVLTQYVKADKLRGDVLDMRRRMIPELAKGTAGQFDIKHDPGGVTDIEFIVQYLVLREACRCPELVRYSDNIRQLEALAREGLLPAAEAITLTDTYRSYRERLHHLALAGEPGFMPRSAAQPAIDAVTGIWHRVFAD